MRRTEKKVEVSHGQQKNDTRAPVRHRDLRFAHRGSGVHRRAGAQDRACMDACNADRPRLDSGAGPSAQGASPDAAASSAAAPSASAAASSAAEAWRSPPPLAVG